MTILAQDGREDTSKRRRRRTGARKAKATWELKRRIRSWQNWVTENADKYSENAKNTIRIIFPEGSTLDRVKE